MRVIEIKTVVEFIDMLKTFLDDDELRNLGIANFESMGDLVNNLKLIYKSVILDLNNLSIHSDRILNYTENELINLRSEYIRNGKFIKTLFNQTFTDEDERNIWESLYKEHYKWKLEVLRESYLYIRDLLILTKTLKSSYHKGSKLQLDEKQKKTYYVWQSNPDKELPELYNLMKNKYKLIAPETTYEQFKAVFTGQPIEIINPIKWKESNRLLAYFLDSIFIGQEWQSIAGNGRLFINSKNKVINANDLSVAKTGYFKSGQPKGYEKIDKILKTIKKD